MAADWNTLGREICRWRSRCMKMVDHVIARMADYVTFDRYRTVAMNIARRGAITPIKPMTAVTIANTTTTIRAIIMNDNNENVDGRWLWRRSRQWAASRYHVRASHDINRLHRTRVRVNERVIDRIVIRRTILDALRTGHLMHVPSAWISRGVSWMRGRRESWLLRMIVI